MNCDRCDADISKAADYGCYLAYHNLNLCTKCSELWIGIKARHNKEDQDFLKSVTK